jgi:hypothetical protein
MPTYIKTGFWDKKAKAPDGWLDLNLFVQTIVPPSTNIYNSDGTLTGNRQLSGNNNNLTFADLNVFKTSVSGNDRGLKLDNANFIYEFGGFGDTQITIDGIPGILKLGDTLNLGTQTLLYISDVTKLIKTQYQGNDIGLKLDFANTVYQFGQLTGGNTTQLKIDDAAAFPVQVSGTNVSSGTAGAASGQFLNVKVNGVDYKIALLNP